MAVAALGEVITDRSEQARVARFARLGALLIDTFLFSIVSLIVNGVFGVAQVTSFSGGPGSFSLTSATQVPWAALTAVWLAYLIGFEAVFGATPGKLLARLRVVRVDGRPLSVGSIWTRNLLRLIDWLPLFYLLGGLSVLMTANSQRVGDRWGGTTVVYRHHASRPDETRNPSATARARFGAVVVAIVLFTALFDYFGRPPLEVQGSFNTHTFFVDGTTSYTLGRAEWGLGSVTYHVTTRGNTAAADCTGTITLTWQVLGWQSSGGSLACGV